jgi:hypothetical protein
MSCKNEGMKIDLGILKNELALPEGFNVIAIVI